VIRRADVTPPEWVRVLGQPWVPRPKPPAGPFGLQDCLQRIRTGYDPRRFGDAAWKGCHIAAALSPEEARFWLEAMTRAERGYGQNAESLVGDLVDQLATWDYDRRLSEAAVVKRLQEDKVRVIPDFALLLAHLIPLESLLDLMVGRRLLVGQSWHKQYDLLEGFREHVVPYLTAAEAEKLRGALRGHLDDPATDALLPWCLAAHLGMHDELRARAAKWADGEFADAVYYHQLASPHLLVLNLGDPKLVEAQARRTRLRLLNPDHVSAWLFHTKWHAPDVIRDSILPLTRKEDAEKMTRAFAQVQAPELAPAMLELKLASKAPAPARQWLDDNPGNAIAGLIPVAGGKGKLAGAAVEYLREGRRKGFGDFIDAQLKLAAPDVAAKVRDAVLGQEETVYLPLDDRTTPGPLRDALAAPTARGKLPDWVRPTNLPPVLVAGRRLTEGQLAAVLAALKQSNIRARPALVAALLEHADRGSLDAFGWRLFELWLAEGAPAKDKWAFTALAHVGGDAAALKLTPLLRAWPTEGQHQRAVTGLECLRAIGTDTALTQLHAVAQRVKSRALQKRAREFMDAIAKQRGLTRDALEDRIIPDLGLDERGGRTFDFGPRQFRTVVGPDLRPLVRDGDGKLREDLPKPGAKDEADKAGAAVAEWKLLKKQLREAVKVQAFRLEQAMVTGRRWPPGEFAALLVRHPLLVNLVRRLLWAGYDARGKPLATFRVTEEREYADARDKPCPLKGVAAVGVAHALHLAEQERSAWGEVFGDYEIIAPFPQLARPVYRLVGEEADEPELTRFAGVKVPGVSVASHLERSGWQRGPLHDHGDFHEHYKQFPGADVTAVAEYDGGLWAGNIADPHPVAVKRCTFLKGLVAPDRVWRRDQPKALTLGDVDPVVLSEVLADLTFLASKAE
jgi:hypothetical protein